MYPSVNLYIITQIGEIQMRKTKWRGHECPPLYELHRNGGMLQLTLYANPRQENVSDGGEIASVDVDQWVADALTLPIGVLDYGSIVSAFINNEYPYDRMQAIINNHLLWGESNGTEYEAMQKYRKKSKDLAKEIVRDLNTTGEE